MLIDTHTHLETFARHGVLPETLQRASSAGVSAMIAIGTSPEDWALYRQLAEQHPGFIFYTVGLHPCAVEADWERAIEQLPSYWAPTLDGSVKARPVALGEIGLDRFHLPKDDPKQAEVIFARQRAAFAEGLALGKKFACPVVVHSRGAFLECVEMIDRSGVDWAKVVFHCFTEGEREMAELSRRGAWASFTGIITYKNADAIRAAAKAQGLARLMIETDAPYLTPIPHRGKPNEPAFLRHTADFVAANVFGVSFEELAETTTANARAFFAI
ncbi:MAG: TatD family hydrolase [Opitutus sp.]